MAMLFCYNTMALKEKPAGKWEGEGRGFTMTMTSITTVAFDIVEKGKEMRVFKWL